MAVPEIIVELVQRFDQPRSAYRSGEYNEMQLRCAVDRQIDALVYELYGLTGEEIRLVEGG
jgi:hypothetical protein